MNMKSEKTIRRLEEAHMLLWSVYHHFTIQGHGVQGPGHLHKVPGMDDMTGGVCEWCGTWAEVEEYFKGRPLQRPTQDRVDQFNQNNLVNRESKYLWKVLWLILRTLMRRVFKG